MNKYSLEGNTNLYATTVSWTSTINWPSVDSESSSVPDTSRPAVADPRNSTVFTVLAAARGANVRDEPTAAAESRATERFHNERKRAGERGGVVCLHTAECAATRHAVPGNHRDR